MIDLKAIRERAAKATDGQWYRNADNDVVDDRDAPICGTYGIQRSGDDAEFIAHARADVPALCAEVERLRAEVERLRLDEESYAQLQSRCYDQGGTGSSVFGEVLRLRAQLDGVMKAVDAEPELPDEETDDAKLFIEAVMTDRDTLIEGMRIVVRITKEGIKARILALGGEG